nr:hypothetical protein [uncultured Blautia sp.]
MDYALISKITEYISCGTCILLALAIKKRKLLIKNKIIRVLCMLLPLLLLPASRFVMKNLQFDTLSEAVDFYGETGKDMITVEGKNSALVYGYIKKDEWPNEIFRKKNDKYQMPIWEWKEYRSYNGGKYNVWLQTVKNTGDYYVNVYFGSVDEGKSAEISDSENSKFYQSKAGNMYYGYAGDISDDYCVFVNGEKIEIMKELINSSRQVVFTF